MRLVNRNTSTREFTVYNSYKTIVLLPRQEFFLEGVKDKQKELSYYQQTSAALGLSLESLPKSTVIKDVPPEKTDAVTCDGEGSIRSVESDVQVIETAVVSEVKESKVIVPEVKDSKVIAQEVVVKTPVDHKDKNSKRGPKPSK